MQGSGVCGVAQLSRRKREIEKEGNRRIERLYINREMKVKVVNGQKQLERLFGTEAVK